MATAGGVGPAAVRPPPLVDNHQQQQQQQLHQRRPSSQTMQALVGDQQHQQLDRHAQAQETANQQVNGAGMDGQRRLATNPQQQQYINNVQLVASETAAAAEKKRIDLTPAETATSNQQQQQQQQERLSPKSVDGQHRPATNTNSSNEEVTTTTTRSNNTANSTATNSLNSKLSQLLFSSSSPSKTTMTGKVSRLTKWLCAIIVVLVLIVLALVLFDCSASNNGAGPSSHHSLGFRGSRAQKFIEKFTGSKSQQQQNQQLETSSSEDTLYLESYPDDETDSQHHNDEHQQDNSNGNGHQSEDDSNSNNNNNQDPDGNQILQPANRQPAKFFVGPTAGRPAAPNSRLKAAEHGSICLSPGCIRAAAQILNNLDNQTRPCDDFYQFACGRWIQTQLIPDEKTSLSVFSQNTADLNVKLRGLIERPASESDAPIVGQMRNMYASCMNLTDIERRGDEPLLDVLRDLGGWPVVGGPPPPPPPATASNPPPPSRQGGSLRRRSSRQSSSNNSSGDEPVSTNNIPASPFVVTRPAKPAQQRQLDWLDIIIKFRQRGFSHDMIIDLSVVPDVRNSRSYIIELDQSSLGLPDRSYYFKGLNDSTVAAYYQLMVDSATMLGAPADEARRQMSEALEFETQLARISVPREQRRNITRLYNKMPIRQLYQLAPNIDWQRYLSSLLKLNGGGGEQQLNLDLDSDEVIVKVPSFLRQLDALLVATNQRIVANYMIWRIVRHSMSGLSRRWRQLAHGYNSVTTGRQAEEPRWEQCLGSLDGTLGTALSALYVRHHFNGRSKAAALEMVNYIREEFLRILDEIDWMDDETRKEARLKAQGIAAYIGYPDELLRTELIEELYAGVRLSRTNFYQNIRRLRIWSTDYAFGQLRRPNKRGDWKKHARAAVVNAYYNSLENSIEFPAGILQGAFFDADRPNYMNFGAIGYVIGHEITHGFDDRGRQFDRDGNDRNWWKPKTDAQFRERAQCIVEQYGNYSVAPGSELRVNGVNTQGENIADNGGIKEAFRAYRRWTKDHGREQRLPGLDYTPDQLFWISAANIWCGKFRPEVMKLRVNSGVHSPARLRIIGPLSNSEEFAQSFNCPRDSPMNPRKKCSVW